MITRDITERRQQREEIKNREAQLDAFFSNAPVGLAIIDNQLRFRRINGPFSLINGLEPEENIGKRVGDVVQDLASQIEPLVRKVIRDGEPVINYEVTGPTPATPDVRGWWLKSFFPITREGEVVTQIGVGCARCIGAEARGEDGALAKRAASSAA